MSWFYWSLLQIPLVSIVWLVLRKSQLKGLSSELSLLILFVFTILGLLLWHSFTGIAFIIPPLIETLILLLAGSFAVLANLSLLHSFENSENPGFSLAISSSKILLITFGSFLIFNDSISPIAMLGIATIIFGIFFMYGSKTQTSFKWETLALLAAFFSSLYWLLIKFIDQRIPDLYLTVILALVIAPQIAILTIVVLRRHEVAKSLLFIKSLTLLAFGGIIAALGNIIGIHALLLAPNPGYSLAITLSYVVVVAIISKLWLKSSLRPQFTLASIIIIIGVAIIHIGA